MDAGRRDATRRSATLYGVRFGFIVDREETGGALSIVECVIPPKTLVKPHKHLREDEFSVIQEGRLGVRLGDEELEVRPGDHLVKPRGVPHAIWNPTDEPAKLIEILAPGGFERYFEEVEPILAGLTGNAKSFYELAERYGVEVIDPWVDEIGQKHGVTLYGDEPRG
jgi:mannose-6-phosphate isomerase-like protein (cupin superfamily)